MTKKGFEFKLCSNGMSYLWKDNELYITKTGDYVIYEHDNDITDLLNNLSDENNQLKKRIEALEK